MGQQRLILKSHKDLMRTWLQGLPWRESRKKKKEKKKEEGTRIAGSQRTLLQHNGMPPDRRGNEMLRAFEEAANNGKRKGLKPSEEMSALQGK